MKKRKEKIFYYKPYFGNFEVGQAVSYGSKEFQTSSIIVKPFGVNVNNHGGKYPTNTLEEFLENTITRENLDYILGKYALLIVRILQLLNEYGTKDKFEPTDAFYCFRDNVHSKYNSIYIGKPNERSEDGHDFENIKIRISEFPMIKVSLHSDFDQIEELVLSESARSIPIFIFDEIKELIFKVCSEVHRLLSQKIKHE